MKGGTSFGGEGILFVACPSAGEVATYVAVTLGLYTVHHDFRTVVQLWDTACGEQQGSGLLQHGQILPFAQEAVGVVVLDKGEYAGWVGIEEVVDEVVVHTVQSLEPGFSLFVLGDVYLVEETEVHHRLQITVLRCREFGVFLPPGGIGRFGNPCFAYGIVVGVFLVQFLHPLAHTVVVGIRVGIHTDAVDVGKFNPPEAVLDEISQHVRVLLVEVGHGGYKPAVVHLVEVVFRCIGVYVRSQFEGSLYEVLLVVGIVEPVF